MKFPNHKGFLSRLFSRFTKKNREEEISELPKGAFGEAQNVRELWDLDEKDSYLRHRGRRVPRFLLPVAIFLLVGLLIFWLLPGLVNRYAGKNADTPVEATEITLIYGDSTRVVTKYAANVMSRDDIKSERVTQVLYNEPITILDRDCAAGFVHIRTGDGLTGYMLDTDMTDKRESIEPALHKYKLVVSDVSKNVMSNASNGTLLVRVMMNTVLYADVRSDGVYQVALPDGTNGWISSSGVIELGVDDAIQQVGVRYFVGSVLSFINVTQIDHGLTIRGMSVEGLAYVTAGVNGVTLPRTMEGQMGMGARVDLTYDQVTGTLNVSSIEPGDLVFFRDPNDASSAAPYEMAICTDTGSLLMTSTSRTALRVVTLTDNETLAARIIAVRRIFT